MKHIQAVLNSYIEAQYPSTMTLEIKTFIHEIEEAMKLDAAALTTAPQQTSELLIDRDSLDWLDKHCDGADHSGYGADDMWWKLTYNDGNLSEGATIREAVAAAMKSGQEGE